MSNTPLFKEGTKASAVIVAAGGGTRMGGVIKPLIKLGSKTVFEYVLAAFAGSEVCEIIIVCRDKSVFAPLIPADYPKPVVFAEGGATRTGSVYNGVNACSAESELICIHDCARPFVTADIIDSVIFAAREFGAASASSPVFDTIKYIDEDSKTIYTPDRSFLHSVQTPQVIGKKLYLAAYLNAAAKKLKLTDETGMAEAAGYKVAYVDSPRVNFKLTTPEDIKIAKAMMFLKERGEL